MTWAAWAQASASTFQASAVIADIHSEMHSPVFTHNQQRILDSISVQMKPSKGVIAEKAFAKGKLVLVPYTLKVVLRKAKMEPLASGVQAQGGCPGGWGGLRPFFFCDRHRGQ